MEDSAAASETMTDGRAATVLLSIFLIALCGLLYELLLGTIATYMLGDSVKQFSYTIGLFLSAMGLGSFLSRYFRQNLVERFLEIELVITALGSFSTLLLLAVFAYARPAFRPVLYSTIVVLGTCIGMEIPILTRVLKRFGSLRDAISGALALDYVGALVASVGFPLFLYPYLGLMRTAIVAGAINLMVVLINLRVFKGQLINTKRVWVIVFLLAPAMAFAFVRATWLTDSLEGKVFKAPVIWAVRSPYQKCVLTKRGENPSDLRMWINGSIQFSSLDEHRYHEALVHPPMLLSRSRANVLILGGGDGLVAREVLKYGDVDKIVLVDIDPAITRLSQTHPELTALNQNSMNDPKVEIANVDAYEFLENDHRSFDVVLIDLPDPDCIELAKLFSLEAFKLVELHLNPGGTISVQATSPYFSPRAYWCIETTMKEAGLQTFPYHNYVPSLGSWGYILASNAAQSPEAMDVTVPTRYLDTATARDLFRFPPDMVPVNVKPNKRFDPVIVRYYEQDWNTWSPS